MPNALLFPASAQRQLHLQSETAGDDFAHGRGESVQREICAFHQRKQYHPHRGRNRPRTTGHHTERECQNGVLRLRPAHHRSANTINT